MDELDDVTYDKRREEADDADRAEAQDDEETERQLIEQDYRRAQGWMFSDWTAIHIKLEELKALIKPNDVKRSFGA